MVYPRALLALPHPQRLTSPPRSHQPLPSPTPHKFCILPYQPLPSLKRKLLPRNHRRRLLLRRILLPTHRARIRAIRTFITVLPPRLDLRDAFLARALRCVGGVGVFGGGGEELALLGVSGMSLSCELGDWREWGRGRGMNIPSQYRFAPRSQRWICQRHCWRKRSWCRRGSRSTSHSSS